MPRLRPLREPTPPAPPPPEKVEAAAVGEADPKIDEPEVVVVDADEPEPPKAGKEDPTLALQKQIEELRKSEELQRNSAEQARREREEALRQSQTYRADLEASRKTAQEQEEVAIGSALAAAKAEAEKAESDFVNAESDGDARAKADAIRRISIAGSRIDALERGMEEIEARKKAPPPPLPQQPQRPPTADEIVDTWNVPATEKAWAKAHPDYVTDTVKVAHLRYANELARSKGYNPGNPAYLADIESTLGMGKKTEPTPEPTTNEEQQRSSIMSAPVSRETPTSTGQRQSRVTLTREDKEYAKISGITEVEYAKQKQKLADMKANGEYSDRR